MATIEMDGKTEEVKDGDPIKDACEKLGVPFGCQDGACGVCNIEVLEGKENLTELTENEKVFGMTQDSRLACQCKIKSGNVKIKY